MNCVECNKPLSDNDPYRTSVICGRCQNYLDNIDDLMLENKGEQ